MYQVLPFTADSQAAQAPWIEFQAVKGFWLVGAQICAQTFTGTPTSANIDVNDDGVAIAGFTAAPSQATAGTPAIVKTTALGGAVALPAHVDADSIVAIDLNFVAGTAPTVTDFTVLLYILPDE